MLSDSVGSGAIAYLTRDDIAAVTATLLTDGGYEGQTLDLPGPSAVTPAELAAARSEVTWVRVSYRPVTDREFADTLVSQASPSRWPPLYTTAYRAAREGWLSRVSDLMGRVVGRPATSVAEFLSVHRATLVGPR